MSVTTGMVGSGFYNRNSASQWMAIDRVLPWLEEAIGETDLRNEGTFAMADYGCSEGANSLRVAGRLLEAVRAKTERPVLTLHSDLPTNDYRWLLENLRQDGRSALGEGVFSALVGGSMYDQLLPPGSLQVATCFNAIGFYSERPLAALPGYILANGPSERHGVGSVSEEERAACAARALADTEAFLTARATELARGGWLLLDVFGRNEEARTCDGVYDALNAALLEVLEAGMIERAAFEAYYQPVYFRNLDELTAPLAAKGAGLADAFELRRAESTEVAIPFVEAYRRDGDAAAYAKSCTDYFRAFTESALRLAFPGGGDRLIEEVYGRAERIIRADPEAYLVRFVSVAMLLRRK